MKRHFLLLTALLFISVAAIAQKRYSGYAIGFYNLENLFDTVHDAGKRDYDFLPKGSYHWDNLRYTSKLKNMARALADMGTDPEPLKNIGCAAIGVAEVENARALTDLVNQEPLKARGFKFVHFEGPDRRGIDCALLYNPSLFQVRDAKLVPYRQELEKDSAFHTRGFLTVSGTIAGEHVAIIVAHLPSRFSTSFYRESGARQMRAIKDSLIHKDPYCKVLVMGDMNDDPTNKSMVDGLQAKPDIDKVEPEQMYNPWYNTLAKQGQGTLAYNGSWNLFDQIILSPNLLNQNGRKDFSSLKFWKHQIVRRDYLLQQEGKYKGTPKRTTAGGVWLNGYSDHLPVVVYLMKEQL